MDLSPIVLAHEAAFAIGDVEVRPATREIVCGGNPHVIEPRVMQLLVALHRASGAVVSKDDLGHLVWEGRIVGEDAINRVVSRLRAVAEKQAGGEFRIETITKVGYRLITDGVGADESSRSPTPAYRPSRRAVMVGAAAAAVLGGGAIVLRLSSGKSLPGDAQRLVDSAQDGLYSGSVEDTASAIGALRQAAQIAPSSELVWGQLAYAYMRQSIQAPSDQRANLRTRAQAAIQRALSIDPEQPDALAAQVTGMRVFRNWIEVDRACRLRLKRHPTNTGLLQQLGNVLMQTGRTIDALPILRQVIQQRPDVGRLHVGECLALWTLGRLDEADAAVASAMSRWPRFYAIWFTAVYYRMYGGKPAEAAAMVGDVANRPIGIPDWNFDLVAQQATALAGGDPSKIRDAVRASAEMAHRGTGFAENAAIFAAFVGDLDTAFALLAALYFNRGFSMPDAYFAPEQGEYSGADRHTYNLFVPAMRTLRRDPRFRALTAELGLDEYWRVTNSRSRVIV